MNTDIPTQRPGRVPVLVATIGFFSIAVLGVLGDPDTPSIIRLLVTGALAIAIYHGHDWARWLFLVLVILAEIFIAYTALTMPMPQFLLGILLVLYILFAALLFVPSWGGQYFDPPDTTPPPVDTKQNGPG